MAMIPGTSWIHDNCLNIMALIGSQEVVNPTLVRDKFTSWKSLNFLDPNGKHANRLDKTENFKKVRPIALTSLQYRELRARKNSFPGLKPFRMTSVSNVLVGHGGESMLDTSLSLHPYYGFPVIPGSAIKGVTLHYCKDEDKLTDHIIKEIFGSAGNAGGIMFFDAWPINIIEFLVMDIMTPHYPKYYGNQALPTDNQSPIPIPFLAVRKDVTFEFGVAPTARFSKMDNQVVDTLMLIKSLINEALEHYGIGAKSGSGYGYFKKEEGK